jgi:hypothetical protein
VPLRQPIPDVRRQQKRLLTIDRDEVLAHTDIVLSPRTDPPFTQRLHGKEERAGRAGASVPSRR